MESKRKSKSGYHSSDSASLDLLGSIQKLAESGIHKEYLTYDEFLDKLRTWWCQYYKRPYKDPLLDTYTIEELAFEYYDINRDRSAKSEDHEDHKVSEAVEAEDRAWAAEEDAKELAEITAARAAAQREAKEDALEDDTIVEEIVGLTDEQWANKYDEDHVLTNPSADDIDQGGDVSATFGV